MKRNISGHFLVSLVTYLIKGLKLLKGWILGLGKPIVVFHGWTVLLLLDPRVTHRPPRE